MDFEKEYKSLVGRITKAHLYAQTDSTRAVLEEIYPSLSESEDERIRKALVKYFDERNNYRDEDETFNGIPFSDIIAYLEKQKEQKPLSTEETELNSIAFLEQMGYTCIPPKKEHQNNSDAPKNALGGGLNSPLDKDKNLDEIAQDYIDGVKEYNPEPTWDLMQTAVCYGYHLAEQKEQKLHLTVSGKEVYKICPRCKSRMIRDDSKVYTSMPPQYGYECPKCGEMEFDTVKYDNPEMEEQKPAEWSKNDTVFLNEITDFFENKTTRLQHDIDMYAHWLKSLPKRFNLQPKKEWSEEDEKIRLDTISAFYLAYPYAVESDNPRKKNIDWLKSLPERFNLQPKQEWDTYDKAEVICIACCLDGQFVTEAARKQALEWFNKHRRDFLNSPSWKPSEEQMEALCKASDLLVSDLNSLYNDLKKLM